MNQSDKRPETPFEAASYDLNKFRERRMADRRFHVRDTPDRRKSNTAVQAVPQPQQQSQAPGSGIRADSA